jgi:hypothetical protein
MSVKEIGIILHGATGRIGATQHLANALAPIRAEGGNARQQRVHHAAPAARRTECNSPCRTLRSRHGIADWTGGPR